MKKLLLGLVLLLSGCSDYYAGARSDVYITTTAGLGQKIGEVSFQDTSDGLLVTVDLQNIPQGEHGFHIHQNPDCGALADAHGQMQPALKAGGHYDPYKTGHHLGPNQKQGHQGDLPYLTADQNGQVKTSFYMPNLQVKDIKNRSLIVHAGGDNYRDTPLPLGGGGARIACGVIE